MEQDARAVGVIDRLSTGAVSPLVTVVVLPLVTAASLRRRTVSLPIAPVSPMAEQRRVSFLERFVAFTMLYGGNALSHKPTQNTRETWLVESVRPP